MRRHHKTKSFFEKYWLIVLLIIIGVFYIYMLQFSGTLMWDEMVYLSNARSHTPSPSFFNEDFRFPLLELVIGSTWLITGESIFIAQLLIIAFSLFGIYGVALLSRQYQNEGWSAITTILFAVSSPLIYWGFRIYTDVPAMTLTIFATYFFIKFLESRKYVDVFTSGIFCSLAFLMRFPTVLVGLVIGFFVLRTKNFYFVKKFFLGNALILAPWMIINTLAYKDPFWDFFAQSSVVSQYTAWQSSSILLHHIWQAFSFGLIFLIPFLWWTYKEKKSMKVQVLIALLSIHLITYLGFINLKFERYILMFLPFIILAISIGLSQSSSLLFKRIKSNYATIITMILFAILLFFMVSFSLTKVEHIQEISVCETNGALDQATVYVKETVPMGETILSNHWPWFGYHGNHQTLAIFNSSVSSIIDLSHVKPTRVIHVRYQGLYFNTTELQSDQRLILDKNFTDNCGFNVEVYFVNKSLKRI